MVKLLRGFRRVGLVLALAHFQLGVLVVDLRQEKFDVFLQGLDEATLTALSTTAPSLPL